MTREEWLEKHGQAYGLTLRESQVISLITEGLTNLEIAERTYLSINSVKTYIRSAYRKIGASRRAQAVVWGMTNGFAAPVGDSGDEDPADQDG